MRSRERVKIQTKSGAAATQIRLYKYANQMSFLKTSIAMRETSSNLPDAEIIDEDTIYDTIGEEASITSDDDQGVDHIGAGDTTISIQENTLSAPSSSSMPQINQSSQRKSSGKAPKRKSRNCDSFEDAMLKAVTSKKVPEKTQQPRDHDEMFLLSLLPTLKRLSDRQKASIKVQFQTILLESEFPVNIPSQVHPPQSHQYLPYQTPFMPDSHTYRRFTPRLGTPTIISEETASPPTAASPSSPHSPVYGQRLSSDTSMTVPIFQPL